MVPLPRKTTADFLNVPKTEPSGTSSGNTSEVDGMFEDGWDKPNGNQNMWGNGPVVDLGPFVDLDSMSEGSDDSAIGALAALEGRKSVPEIVGDPAMYFDDVELEFGSGRNVNFADSGQSLAELRRMLSADSDSSKNSKLDISKDSSSIENKKNGDADPVAKRRKVTSINKSSNANANSNVSQNAVPSLGSMMNDAFASFDHDLSPMGASSGEVNSEDDS